MRDRASSEPIAWDFLAILETYQGSDGGRTTALYDALQACGSVGAVAVNLFRACKASERAKVYRGRGYRSQAYDKKSWSMDNLAATLAEHGKALGIGWGWGEDEAQPFHRHVLYIDLPTGQVSFHTTPRGPGPDYAGQWDQVRNMGPMRICRFCANVLAAEAAA